MTQHPLVKFGDVVRQVKDKVDPQTAGLERYVAGEHMDTDNLHIRRWGDVGAGYLGPAFHMRFQPGQILYGSRRTYLRKIAVADFEGITANTTYVIEPKDPEVLLPDFLPFVMSTERFHEHSIKQSKGSVNPYINFSDITWYEFPLPPVDEQRRIADLLWAADDVISSYQEVLENLEKLNVRITEKLFSKGIDDSETTQTEIGSIPSHWQLKQLQEITSTVNNGFVGQAAKHYVSDGIPYLLGKNVRENRLEVEELTFISKEFHESSVRSQLRIGDVLTVQSGHVGVSCVVPPEFDGANCHAIIISRPIPDVISGYFLSHYFNSQIGRQRLSGLHIGTTIPHINTSDLRKFKIPVPPYSEQMAIVETCETIIQRIKDIQNHIEISRNLKKQLLSKHLGN